MPFFDIGKIYLYNFNNKANIINSMSELEPRDFVSKDISEITDEFHKRGVMLPHNVSNKQLLAMASGKLRFINRRDADELHPILAKDPALMR